MSPLDTAIRALDRTLARDPDNEQLRRERASAIAQRGTETDQAVRALARIEALMEQPGLSATDAKALLDEHKRLSGLMAGTGRANL